MPLAVYIKEYPAAIQNHKSRDRAFYTLISLVGVASILFSIWPLVVWQIKTLPKLTGKIDQVPIPQGQVLSTGIVQNYNVQVIQDPDGFSYFVPTNFYNQAEGNDLTPVTTNYKPEGPRAKEFKLAIPKLKINDAIVKVDNLNFYKNLSHFPGSALPGEIGNSFITGHSVLPQFNDPKDYSAIFTKLATLEVGDDVYVEISGETLRFTVLYAKVVSPHDLSVLAPISASGKNLTLMTCVPPGTSTKRLVVITSLI